MRALPDDSPPAANGLSYQAKELLEREAEKFKDNLARSESAQGTKFSGLCFHCKHHFAYRTSTMNEPRVFCHATPRQDVAEMPLNVVECSDYQKVASLSLGQMAEIAWVINPRDHLKDGYR